MVDIRYRRMCEGRRNLGGVSKCYPVFGQCMLGVCEGYDVVDRLRGYSILSSFPSPQIPVAFRCVRRKKVRTEFELSDINFLGQSRKP